MTALPETTPFTSATATEGAVQTALADLRAYLAGLLGTDGTPAAALAALGALAGGYVVKTAAYTLATGDRGKVIAASGTWTLGLPAAATAGAGFSFALRNAGTGTITVDPNGAETIDAAATLAVAAGRGAVLVCTGAAWTAVLPVAVLANGEVLTVDPATGRLGINHPAPTEALHLAAQGNSTIRQDAAAGAGIFAGRRADGTLAAPTATGTGLVLANFSGGGHGTDWIAPSSGAIKIISAGTFSDTSYPGIMTFATATAGTSALSERMRIDEAGNVMVGTLTPRGALTIAGNIMPEADNARDLGSAAYRMATIYAGTGAINTSDAAAKTDVAELDAAELRVARAARALLRKYRFRDALAAKGAAARWHVGIVAQDLAAAFAREGLDGCAYGVLCRDVWWEADVTVPAVRDTVETRPARHGGAGRLSEPAAYETIEVAPERVERRSFADPAAAPDDARRVERWGVRYDELLAFVLASV